MFPSKPQVDPNSGCAPWPSDWPYYKQSCYLCFDKRCDMVIGWCQCGGYHVAGEFVYQPPNLYRYGKLVDAEDIYYP